jgi:hypothetical protein
MAYLLCHEIERDLYAYAIRKATVQVTCDEFACRYSEQTFATP